jgi:hypothetical protein
VKWSWFSGQKKTFLRWSTAILAAVVRADTNSSHNERAALLETASFLTLPRGGRFQPDPCSSAGSFKQITHFLLNALPALPTPRNGSILLQGYMPIAL